MLLIALLHSTMLDRALHDEKIRIAYEQLEAGERGDGNGGQTGETCVVHPAHLSCSCQLVLCWRMVHGPAMPAVHAHAMQGTAVRNMCVACC
jgi:hypothetical protein